MFEFLLTVLFVSVFFKCLGLVFRATWGLVKFAAAALLALALPAFLGGLLLVGGLILLVPLALAGVSWGLLRACI